MSEFLTQKEPEIDPRDIIDADSYREANNRAWYRKIWLREKNPHTLKWLEKNDKDWLASQKKRLELE